MARVTDTEVFEIITTTLTDIDVFIDQANLIVTAYLGDSNLSDTVLKEIERNVAAHMLSAQDPRVKSTKVDVLSETYTGTFGAGLASTPYGQNAMLLDSTGLLKRMSEKGGKRSIIFQAADTLDES